MEDVHSLLQFMLFVMSSSVKTAFLIVDIELLRELTVASLAASSPPVAKLLILLLLACVVYLDHLFDP